MSLCDIRYHIKFSSMNLSDILNVEVITS
jgi:hypothetical protein